MNTYIYIYILTSKTSPSALSKPARAYDRSIAKATDATHMDWRCLRM